MTSAISNHVGRRLVLSVAAAALVSATILAGGAAGRVSPVEAGAFQSDVAGTWANYTNGNFVLDLAVDPCSGTVWAATDGGIVRWDPGTGGYQKFTVTDGLASNVVYSVASGEKWFGTVGGGVSRMTADGRWTSFTTADGLADNWVNSVAIDVASGETWFGTKGGVSRLATDGRWTSFTTADGLADNWVNAVAMDAASGEKWFGTWGGVAVLSFGATRWSSCTTAPRIHPDQAIIADLTGSADVHVYRFDVTAPFSHIQASVPDPDNRLAVEIFRACDTSAGAQTGRHIGAQTGRHIGGTQVATRDITFDTGTYYVAISPRASTTSFPIKYHLTLSISQPDPYATRTLILTHEERIAQLFGLKDDDPQLVAWRERLRTFAYDRLVGGVLIANVQTSTDPAVEQAYARWLLDPENPARANAVARALAAWIARVRGVLPNIRYLVLAGDDRVLPHLRLPIAADAERDDGGVREVEYLQQGNVDRGSSVGAALVLDFTLTDDVYTAATPTLWGDGDEVYMPELAVGRLVERPSDMTVVLDAFLARKGELALNSSLTAGYDFMQDAVETADATLASAGLPTVNRTRLWGNALTAASLREAMLTRRQDLAFLGVHASHFLFDLPGGWPMRTDAIAAAPADLSGALAFGLACHAGLNVPGDTHRQSLDFPEVWQRRGVTWVGSTGWAYGLPHLLAYQEVLMTDYTRRLVAGGGATVGEALMDAKRAYYASHDLTPMHAKTLAGTVLYGLPMTRVRVAGGRAQSATGDGADDSTATRSSQTQPDRLTQHDCGIPAGSRVWCKPDSRYPFQQLERRLVHEPEGDYYTFTNQRPRAEAGEPVQPKFQQTLGSVDIGGIVLDPRGVVLTRATYHDDTDFTPLVMRAGVFAEMGPTSLLQQPSPTFNEPGWYPRIPMSLRRLTATLRDGASTTEQTQGNLLLYTGQYHHANHTERLFDEIVLDEYYSASPDQTTPEVHSASVSPSDQSLAVRVEADDPSGIARAVVAYVAGGAPWTSQELTSNRDGRLWEGTIPMAEAYLLQVVDRAGNVTVVDDRGQVHRPCAGPCQFASVYLPQVANGAVFRP